MIKRKVRVVLLALFAFLPMFAGKVLAGETPIQGTPGIFSGTIEALEDKSEGMQKILRILFETEPTNKILSDVMGGLEKHQATCVIFRNVEYRYEDSHVIRIIGHEGSDGIVRPECLMALGLLYDFTGNYEKYYYKGSTCDFKLKETLSIKNKWDTMLIEGNVTRIASNFLKCEYSKDGKSKYTVNYPLKHLDMSNSIISEIGRYSFQNCAKLETVLLSKTLAKVGYGSFTGCKKLDPCDDVDSSTPVYKQIYGMQESYEEMRSKIETLFMNTQKNPKKKKDNGCTIF